MFKRESAKSDNKNFAKNTKSIAQPVGLALRRAPKSPDESLQDLFSAVQDQYIYPDSKTFADMVPKRKIDQLVREYMTVREAKDFDLKRFVAEHFIELRPSRTQTILPSPLMQPRDYIRTLWSALERDNRSDAGSLIALPNKYLVPGGRFDEQFYWDSYFIMLGLAADGHWSAVGDMVKNFGYMLRRFGRIPTANRTYFLSRSQPPFFALMVELLAEHYGKTIIYARFLPSLLAEYRFWMKGRKLVNESPDYVAFARVVCMPDGSLANRYYDDKQTPRPESSREDIETAAHAKMRDSNQLYRDIRASAESGWDFSSRWFRDYDDLRTVRATDLAPVDLNCLLYKLESVIAESYRLLRQPLLAKRFGQAADSRADMIRDYFWDRHQRFYVDYDFREQKPTGALSLAGLFPLYMRIASKDQARMVVRRLRADFLRPGGLVTTLENTGQQWDAPNGWAPLHWVAIRALKNYGYFDFANEVRDRWLKTVEVVYHNDQKIYEKYNVEKIGVGTGGEYITQDGFGWTNGVYAALKDEQAGEL